MAEYTGKSFSSSKQHSIDAWSDHDPHAQHTGTEFSLVNFSPASQPQPGGTIPYSFVKGTWDSFAPELSGRQLTGAPPLSLMKAIVDSFLAETLSNREIIGIALTIMKGYPESEFGKKMSGYCINQHGKIITLTEPGRIVLTNGASPSPYDTGGKVTTSGLYEVFNVKGDYDQWYLIAVKSDEPRYAAYKKYPPDDFIDGDDIPDTRNLGFQNPTSGGADIRHILAALFL
jgi:hypothetical protein